MELWVSEYDLTKPTPLLKVLLSQPTAVELFRFDGVVSYAHEARREEIHMLGTILLIILILLLIGALPAWPYSRSWGYYPTGGLGLILIIILILLLMGRI
jgi:Protein of unknown function (DUF3309)